ncbi:MAG: hypothetical protein ABI947_10095 [Chloroflexota bacterium]
MSKCTGAPNELQADGVSRNSDGISHDGVKRSLAAEKLRTRLVGKHVNGQVVHRAMWRSMVGPARPLQNIL